MDKVGVGIRQTVRGGTPPGAAAVIATVLRDGDGKDTIDTIPITIVVQNLEKKAGLAGKLKAQFTPDILLVQEFNSATEDVLGDFVQHTSRLGYGTAIHCSSGLPANVRCVKSPAAEIGGFIRKKTIVAESLFLLSSTDTAKTNVQFVSFHGYNGTPFRDVAGLVKHVTTVLRVLHPGPAVFAGDFNTWSPEHLEARNSTSHHNTATCQLVNLSRSCIPSFVIICR